MSIPRRDCGAALWIVGPVGFLVLEAIAAAAFHNYSYTHNYISDLGLTGPRTRLMQTAFWWQGISLLAGAALIAWIPRTRREWIFLGLAFANGVGNCMVGAVHSGPVHGVGALLAILGGNAVILAGWPSVSRHTWYGNSSKVIALVGFLSFIGFVIAPLLGQAFPKGTWERGSVYSILLWQLITACLLLLTRRAATRTRTPNQ